jgi:membrane protein DedA with SNARE-associated domain
VVAAGFFEVPLLSFTSAVTLARLLRYFVIGYLAIRFGKGAMSYLKDHWFLVTMVAIAVVSVSYGLSRLILRHRPDQGKLD